MYTTPPPHYYTTAGEVTEPSPATEVEYRTSASSRNGDGNFGKRRRKQGWNKEEWRRRTRERRRRRRMADPYMWNIL